MRWTHRDNIAGNSLSRYNPTFLQIGTEIFNGVSDEWWTSLLLLDFIPGESHAITRHVD